MALLHLCRFQLRRLQVIISFCISFFAWKYRSWGLDSFARASLYLAFIYVIVVILFSFILLGETWDSVQKLRKRERTYKLHAETAVVAIESLWCMKQILLCNWCGSWNECHQREKLRDKTWRKNGSTREEEMKPGTWTQQITNSIECVR